MDDVVERPRLLIASLVSIIAAALLSYSLTTAFAWDEGWHLLAAQSILRGKHVYLDFCYPQTPLNAYWNAGWMWLFGDTWRTTHAAASIMTVLAVLLTANYLLRRFPVERWRVSTAVTGAALVGLNAMVFEFGSVGQAYGLALFLMVAAFRATVAGVERESLLLPALAGFLSSAAANATLLTAPVAPVLLLWMLIYNQAGNRWKKLGAFAGAAAIPCLPLAWLFSQSPRLTLFSVFEYNYYYRRVDWEGASAHDIEVMIAWLGSSQAFVLVMLAAGGLLFVRMRSRWEHSRRAEFYLCAWLAATLAIHISRGHPNFERYYLLTVPFLAPLACAGLYAVGSRLLRPDRPFWPVTVVCLLAALGLGKAIWETRDYYDWWESEDIARKIVEVTPPGGKIFADELAYFLSRRPPPSGMELADSHKFNLAPATMAEYHLISKQELERRVKAGEFDTVECWEEEDKIKELGLAEMYKNKAVIHEAKIFWGKKR